MIASLPASPLCLTPWAPWTSEGTQCSHGLAGRWGSTEHTGGPEILSAAAHCIICAESGVAFVANSICSERFASPLLPSCYSLAGQKELHCLVPSYMLTLLSNFQVFLYINSLILLRPIWLIF